MEPSVAKSQVVVGIKLVAYIHLGGGQKKLNRRGIYGNCQNTKGKERKKLKTILVNIHTTMPLPLFLIL